MTVKYLKSDHPAVSAGVDIYVNDFGSYRITHYRNDADGEWIAIHAGMPEEPAYLLCDDGQIVDVANPAWVGGAK